MEMQGGYPVHPLHEKNLIKIIWRNIWKIIWRFFLKIFGKNIKKTVDIFSGNSRIIFRSVEWFN